MFLSPFNEGYSCSLIGGLDADHRIDGVHFEGFRVDGVPILEPDAMTLFTKQATNVTFADR